jgi:guanylate kinase
MQTSGMHTNVIIISAPSGTGKSTLSEGLMKEVGGLVFSISCTTRAQRPGDVDGQNYYFVDAPRFCEMRDNGQFLENFAVYGQDNLYGSPKAFLELARSTGKDLLLDIDVKGAALLRSKIAETISVFIMPPSREELEHRLRGRKDLSEDVIQRRLKQAPGEVVGCRCYDYVVINRTGQTDEAKRQLNSIVQWERARGNGNSESAQAVAWRSVAESCRTGNMEREIQPILETFQTAEMQTSNG